MGRPGTHAGGAVAVLLAAALAAAGCARAGR
ncbi:MAG: hypothetical protein V7603_3958, partial [Micromonosporaceae bacterium]